MTALATCAVVLAGGQGRRAGGPKQFERIGGRTLLEHACAPFLRCDEIGSLVVVVPRMHRPDVDRILRATATKPVFVVDGGASRHLSSRAALAALPAHCEVVLVHDAARPFASERLVRRVLAAADEHGAAIPVVGVHDSVVAVSSGGQVKDYVDRRRLRAVQTPQGFRVSVLRAAFARSRRRDFTDDAAAVRATGGKVFVVEGEPANEKITTAEDLAAAVHRLEEPR
jgi:2-C-methyl-D-erythritol 4-phosphate cytidylyltransferase/2-C-methyl-D-erythritol 2,4-cyclodiphosphate synthase